jgi:hypothetical protein
VFLVGAKTNSDSTNDWDDGGLTTIAEIFKNCRRHHHSHQRHQHCVTAYTVTLVTSKEEDVKHMPTIKKQNLLL